MTASLPTLLQRTADLLRLSGANDFKAGAWEKAAAVVEQEGENLRLRDSEASLRELPNIGKSLASEIHHFLTEGALPQLDELEKTLPGELISWLGISGLGPKRAAKIHQALDIYKLEDLKAALEDGRVASLPGFGAKSARKILNTLTWMEGASDRCQLDVAMDLADIVMRELRKVKGLLRLETAGSLRRGRESIGDLDFLACMEGDDSPLHDRFCELPDVVEILARGDTKSSIRVKQGRQLDLRTVREPEFPAALLYFTGSKEHNVFLRSRAREQEYTLNEYGLYPLQNGEADREHPLPVSSEADLYHHLKLPFTPPELREDMYQAWIEEDTLPGDLVEASDLKGILHAHSTWSDGKNSLLEMAEATMALGYGYLGITDHSQSAFYASGLKPKQVEAQWKEIDQLNQRFRDEGKDFIIYKGIESDIRADGSLDYEDDVLDGFDFVIASLHGQLDMDEEAMQARVEKALHHPACTILGHPTARLLLQRPGVKLDMETIIRLAAKRGVAIELNAAPPRLELDWRWGKLAREVELTTAFCPDAHAVDQLDRVTRFGIPLARKAGFGVSRILNCDSTPLSVPI
ncbi:MAG: DNA polymerase/3'-5' exonuclease PolX [Kiritimatiellae bacterium]|jgi:DNA polymerase (family 10)|nr:DNA polymerase/3'-5' exonuclease PolX [Kiritimatiellia bacterium]